MLMKEALAQELERTEQKVANLSEYQLQGSTGGNIQPGGECNELNQPGDQFSSECGQRCDANLGPSIDDW